MTEFPAPKGLEFPNTSGEGNTFEFLATVERLPNGNLYLKALDGIPIEMPAKHEGKPKGKPMHEGGFLETMASATPDDQYR